MQDFSHLKSLSFAALEQCSWTAQCCYIRTSTRRSLCTELDVQLFLFISLSRNRIPMFLLADKAGIRWQIIPAHSNSIFLHDTQPNVTILQLFI